MVVELQRFCELDNTLLNDGSASHNECLSPKLTRESYHLVNGIKKKRGRAVADVSERGAAFEGLADVQLLRRQFSGFFAVAWGEGVAARRARLVQLLYWILHEEYSRGSSTCRTQTLFRALGPFARADDVRCLEEELQQLEASTRAAGRVETLVRIPSFPRCGTSAGVGMSGAEVLSIARLGARVLHRLIYSTIAFERGLNAVRLSEVGVSGPGTYVPVPPPFIITDANEWAEYCTDAFSGAEYKHLLQDMSLSDRNAFYGFKSTTSHGISMFEYLALHWVNVVGSYTEPLVILFAAVLFDRLRGHYYDDWLRYNRWEGLNKQRTRAINGATPEAAPQRPVRVYVHHLLRLATCLFIIASKSHTDLYVSIKYFVDNVKCLRRVQQTAGTGAGLFSISFLARYEELLLRALRFTTSVRPEHVRLIVHAYCSRDQEIPQFERFIN